MKNKQKLTWIILLLCHFTSCENSTPEPKEDLVEAEAKDGLEIVKTIKKINNDGSYTIGYESDDGSFKIESRDVLGNIKGTYGYVDETGDIKRVSYSSNNFTGLASELPSVVQRIPKTNKTSSSTKRPSVLLYNPTTLPISSTTPQSLSKRRITTHFTTTVPTTTQKSIKTNADAKTTTTESPSIVYATSAPLRNILYQRPLVRSTIAPQTAAHKSEGQIARPETSTGPATELPIIRRLALKNALGDNESSVVKHIPAASEIRSNLLRRQLDSDKKFDPHDHLITLQQGLGEDTEDVYSASLTTGTPRPLFTTTYRSKPLSYPPGIHPNSRYSAGLSNKQEVTTEYTQESVTTDVSVTDSSTPKPVSQYEQQNVQPQFVAVRSPFQEGVVLVPVNQLRLPEQQYIIPNEQYLRQFNPTPAPTQAFPHNARPVYIPKPPPSRSIPVHVDHNGYARPVQQQAITPAPYQVPSHIIPTYEPNYENNEIEYDIDSIKPPVSTRDFQKLIEVLILRQKRLEHVNALIRAQRQRDLLGNQRIRELPPLFIRKPEIPNNQHVSFVPEVVPQQHRHFTPIGHQSQQQRTVYIRPPNPLNQRTYPQPTQTSLRPNRRVARLLQNNPNDDQEEDEYLPPQIREMLLLRMLQLAINPSLPLDSNEIKDEDTAESSEHPVITKGIRNVEILGEEESEHTTSNPNSNFRGDPKNYYA
ncbi:hypothetical protein RN001_004583 [Aquatica leii]|uniref:Uncharacterized protein n=1 Tax=Aquatica leii TaxID=1421715 RepID=A0AAN7SI37_9COLE|nr:hypothetical protein RN001_004583 [Aquatica leii]